MGLEDTKQMPNKADLRWNKGNIQNSLFLQERKSDLRLTHTKQQPENYYRNS